MSPMLGFYTEVIGLSVLGKFGNHDGYDGIFLGKLNENWEIEFTRSDENPEHFPDEDDLLVFYLNSQAEIDALVKRAGRFGTNPIEAKNPYWRENGKILRDPDGFRVCIGLKSPRLKIGMLTKIALDLGIGDWNSLLEHVRDLPYGRNANRRDLSLVLTEAKGSCSSKHALLKAIADENYIPAKLILGVYRMSRRNTPGIGNTLENSGLDFIPEAHCYLDLGGFKFDFTAANSDFSKLKADILHEIEIEPDQVSDFKVKFHQNFVRDWIASEKIALDYDQVWKLRENCIARLSDNTTFSSDLDKV
nr:VOC family protein [Flavobacterium sp.]